MYRKIGLLLMMIMLVMMMAACGEGSVPGVATITGSGTIAMAEREVGRFNALELSIPADLELTTTGEHSLMIEGDDNLLSFIDSDVSDGTLIIRSDEDLKPQAGLRVVITVAALDALTVNGSGDATIDIMDGDTVRITLSGSGDITVVDLNAEMLRVELSGDGAIHLNTADAVSSFVSISGMGTVTADRIISETSQMVISGAGVFGGAGAIVNLRAELSGSGRYEAFDLATDSAEITLNGDGHAQINVDSSLDVVINGSGTVTYVGSPTITQEVSGEGTVSPRE